MRSTHRKRQGRRNNGQGLVEFALILPALLFVVFGIIDFGRVMVIYSGISNGAREAVRYGAVPGRRSDNSYNYMDCDIMRDRARAAVPLMTLDDSQIWLGFDSGYGAPDNPTFICPVGSSSQIGQGDRIVARVQANIQLITPIINNIWPTLPISFTAARTIIKEGVQTGPTATPWPTRPDPPPTWTVIPSNTPIDCGFPGECTMTVQAIQTRDATLTWAAQTATRYPTLTPLPPTAICFVGNCSATGTAAAATVTAYSVTGTAYWLTATAQP